ncbi:carboxypeptidase regulatory-like domain-containing protein [Streptomyces scopuliridis]|uniref:carboxypeptidase-like regulatory domain-containing protein n=1 Tax=Streptomyces scopuliridis TaxID=452529 RepID=UPI00369E6D0F
MRLLGRANWWLPGRLYKRLPHLPYLAVEPREAPETPPLVPPTAPPAGRSIVSAVHGYVRTSEGEPVSAAVVTLVTSDGRQLDRVESLADGSYLLSAPATGSYLLAASTEGRDARPQAIVIGEAPLVHDLVLEQVATDRLKRG